MRRELKTHAADWSKDIITNNIHKFKGAVPGGSLDPSEHVSATEARSQTDRVLPPSNIGGDAAGRTRCDQPALA